MVIAHPAVAVPPHSVPAAATTAVVDRSHPAPYGWQVHVVRSGDTVSALAVRYRTTIAALVARNHLPGHGRMIHPGQRLHVPRTVAAKPDKRTTTKPTASRIHIVTAGQTLSGIAARYRTTVAALAKANRLDPAAWIHPGQRLRVPGGTTPAKKKVTTQKKVIRPDRYRKGGLRVTGDQSRLAVRDLIATTARRHGVDPKLAMAIGWQESGWSQNQYSSAHARGVMQVIPDAGDWASSMVGRKLDLRKTEDNITAGVVILRALHRMADSRDEAIASYYQGFGSVRSRGWYSDTHQYVANVNYFRKRL